MYLMISKAPGTRARDVRKETTDDKNNSVDVEPLLKLLDSREVTEEFSELVDLLSSNILGVLDSRVFSSVFELRTNVVDSLSDTGSGRRVSGRLGRVCGVRRVGGREGVLVFDLGRGLDVQRRDITAGTRLVVEGRVIKGSLLEELLVEGGLLHGSRV